MADALQGLPALLATARMPQLDQVVQMLVDRLADTEERLKYAEEAWLDLVNRPCLKCGHFKPISDKSGEVIGTIRAH